MRIIICLYEEIVIFLSSAESDTFPHAKQCWRNKKKQNCFYKNRLKIIPISTKKQ